MKTMGWVVGVFALIVAGLQMAAAYEGWLIEKPIASIVTRTVIGLVVWVYGGYTVWRVSQE